MKNIFSRDVAYGYEEFKARLIFRWLSFAFGLLALIASLFLIYSFEAMFVIGGIGMMFWSYLFLYTGIYGYAPNGFGWKRKNEEE